jgi:hypothetical protein
MISAKINNLSNWLSVITSADNPRTDRNIETMGIFRDATDPAIMYVFLGARDFDILEEYVQSNDFDNEFTVPSLGIPGRQFIEVSQLNEGDYEQKFRLLISHKIQDFLKWKPYFDDDLVSRREHDLTTIGLGRGYSDPSTVYVFFAYDMDSLAEDYFGNPLLKSKMEEAGVIGEIDMTRMLPLPSVELE